jgi:SpoVK/Ycf46/Vps4 family AAA+-type ATPase
VQGAGKSLCAKAIANDWNLPLLKMDPSSLYNKYIGESEKNFMRAITTAEKISPVVLWIDEIEKAFAAVGEMDGGVSQRVLGLFLSWLQEREGDVFVVATANDVSKLPPELIRKGRFDEMFFVDLPDAIGRAEILKIHLRKRKRDAEKFDMKALAEMTDGFSGAELEQVIVSSLYTAFSSGSDITTEILLSEAKQTVPLSRTMTERITALRNWAKERANCTVGEIHESPLRRTKNTRC